MEKAGLWANPKKSCIGFREVKYLGFLVGHSQIHPLPDKVTTLEQAPQLTNKRQLHRFLGSAGNYSCFVGQRSPAPLPPVGQHTLGPDQAAEVAEKPGAGRTEAVAAMEEPGVGQMEAVREAAAALTELGLPTAATGASWQWTGLAYRSL